MNPVTHRASEHGDTVPENYEKYFVPVIGAPLADRLLRAAAIRPGERVLDVACGTGVVTRRVLGSIGPGGTLAGLDVNPGMIAVARAASPDEAAIAWYETSMEATPLPDDSFDVVLCQMGLQFMTDRQKALGEIRRVLCPGGRVLLNLPGPTPALFAEFRDALARHIGPRCAGFVDVVFSLHDGDVLRRLLTDAGFEQIDIDTARVCLPLPDAEDFMWQYVHSTPMAAMLADATDEQRTRLSEDVCQRWQPFVEAGTLTLHVDVTTVLGA